MTKPTLKEKQIAKAIKDLGEHPDYRFIQIEGYDFDILAVKSITRTVIEKFGQDSFTPHQFERVKPGALLIGIDFDLSDSKTKAPKKRPALKLSMIDDFTDFGGHYYFLAHPETLMDFLEGII